jgi:hypothetical protein
MITILSRAVVLSTVIFASSVVAEEELELGDKVVRTPDGKVSISSVVLAPNSCYSAGKAFFGSPEEVTWIENAIPVTQPLMHSGEVCMMMLTPVKFSSFTTEVPEGAQAIVLYTLDEVTGNVNARALAIPEK